MQSTVVLTNDDGVESPLLAAFAEEVAKADWCRELRLVVPARERSWIAKAITRFDPLVVSETVVAGHQAHVVHTASGGAGTPADCVGLGLWNLHTEPADLVLSGINIGINAGSAFAASSGTLGGAIEASVNGVPAIAISAEVPREVIDAWWTDGARDESYASNWRRLAACATRICGALVGRATSARTPLSVNLPWSVTPQTPARMTRLKKTAYRGLFTPDPTAPGTFHHRFAGFLDEPEGDLGPARDLPADLDTLAAGEVSVSALGVVIGATDEPALAAAIHTVNSPGVV